MSLPSEFANGQPEGQDKGAGGALSLQAKDLSALEKGDSQSSTGVALLRMDMPFLLAPQVK